MLEKLEKFWKIVINLDILLKLLGEKVSFIVNHICECI